MQIKENIFYQGKLDEQDYPAIERDVMRFLLDDCVFVYYHNIDKDIKTFTALKDSNKEETMSTLKENDFGGAIAKLVEQYAHPEDRAIVMKAMTPKYYIDLLKDRKQETVFYRWMVEGQGYIYNKIVISKLENADEPPHQVMIRCYEIEEEFRNKLEEDNSKRRYMAGVYALSREYTSVYYVELDKNQVSPFNLSNRIAGMFGDKFYKLDYDSAIATYVESAVIEEEKTKMLKVLSRTEVIKNLRRQDAYTHVYLNNENKYCEMKVVKIDTEDGSNVAVMGFAVNDEQIRTAQESKRRMDFQLSLLDGLGREYHTIWLVRADESLQLYRSTGKATIQKAVKRGLDVPYYTPTMKHYVDHYVSKEDRKRVGDAVKWSNVLKNTPEVGILTVTYRRVDEKGVVVYHQMCFAKAMDPEGHNNIVLAFRDADDVVRQQLAEEQKYQDALKERDIDGLTGIYNRYCYERTIEEMCNIDKKTVSCVYIDVDGLHELNNNLGHEAGDNMLRFIANSMADFWGRENTFRIGGDEFVSFSYDAEDDQLADEISELRSRIKDAGYSASIGCVTEDIEGLDVLEFIKWAESQMYEAKRKHYSGANDRRKTRQEKKD